MSRRLGWLVALSLAPIGLVAYTAFAGGSASVDEVGTREPSQGFVCPHAQDAPEYEVATPEVPEGVFCAGWLPEGFEYSHIDRLFSLPWAENYDLRYYKGDPDDVRRTFRGIPRLSVETFLLEDGHTESDSWILSTPPPAEFNSRDRTEARTVRGHAARLQIRPCVHPAPATPWCHEDGHGMLFTSVRWLESDDVRLQVFGFGVEPPDLLRVAERVQR